MSAQPEMVPPLGDPASGSSGSLPVLRRFVTQTMINDYAKASGDFNPIHVDPDYARNGPYGQTIAHGLMTLAFVSQLLNEWSAGRFDCEGELDIAFTGPVFANDTVEISGQIMGVVERDGRMTEEIEIVCMVGDRKVLAGKAFQPVQRNLEA